MRLRKKIYHLNKEGSKTRTKNRIHQMERQIPKSASARAIAETKSLRLQRDKDDFGTIADSHHLHMTKVLSLKHQRASDLDVQQQHTEHIHLNHHEFENVDWNTVYQYMPIESRTVYERRVRNGEVQSWWGG